MTEQQYEEQKEKVKKYSEISSEIKRLNLERSRVDCGILEIECMYKIKIDCCGRYMGFNDNLKNVLIGFYDSEIERLGKELEAL